MAEKEVKNIDNLIDQGLNAENNELDLREKELDDEDLIKVLESDKVKGVTALFLEFNEIGDEGLKALAKSKNMLNLSELILSDNEISHEGAKMVATSNILCSLVSLWL